MALSDILYTGAEFGGGATAPRRYRPEDRAKMDDYQAQYDAYKTAVDDYNKKLAEYNAAAEAWNAGPRTDPFTGVQPTQPGALPFTEDDVTAFQEEAKKRALAGSNAVNTAFGLFRSPNASITYSPGETTGTDIQFNFAGAGFADGGAVGIGAYMPYTGYTGYQYADGGVGNLFPNLFNR
jgi:hypothetical protein